MRHESLGPHQPLPSEGNTTPEIHHGRLIGKIGLVTGGSEGIGAAVVEAFAREGMRKIYVVSRGDANEVAEKALNYGTEVVHVRADMSSREGVDTVIDTVVASGDKITTLVNNVGKLDDRPLETASWEGIERTYQTNIIGAHYLVGRALATDLLPEGASIINSGSIVGPRGNFMQEEYGGTKGAMRAFTFSAARSLGRKRIRVNIVEPGFVRTKLTEPVMQVQGTLIADLTPLGRVGVPEDIAGAYVFLASDESSYVSGADLRVDGGFSTLGAEEIARLYIKPTHAQRRALRALAESGAKDAFMGEGAL